MSSSIAYFNGSFLPLAEVSVSPLDRGFLFADGVYEVIPAYNGRLFRAAEHLQRLNNSSASIALNSGLNSVAWETLLNELIQRNGGGNLTVYLQITRGAPASRDHGFPPPQTRPTIFAMVNPLQPMEDALGHGINAITLEDVRWGACHIKSIALLANVLARQQALGAGTTDALLVRDGFLTEGTAGNIFLVHGDVLLTPPKDWRILPGITRDLILQLAEEHDISYREQDLPVAFLADASEVWLTSSIREIVPVTNIDGKIIGDGMPGPHWRRMMDLYQSYKCAACLLTL
jgi:D-alanine transaminase